MVHLFRRFFHSGSKFCFSVSEKAFSVSGNVGALATLRKKTGYSIANCKKALDLHNNDLANAEAWLIAQAQAQGWAKASKLQSRQASQGLVGVSYNKEKASIVEVNCETDFVARNEKFQSLVATVANSVLASSKPGNSFHGFSKGVYSSEETGKLPASESGSLADLVALNIGQLGENMVLRRAVAVQRQDPSVKIVCHTHPSVSIASNAAGSTLLGKYGAIVVLEEGTAPSDIPEGITLENLPRQLCQHIIGMNPLKVGTKDDPLAPSSDEETTLYHQEFVANPDYKVGEILDKVNWKLIDFVRFECGESQ